MTTEQRAALVQRYAALPSNPERKVGIAMARAECGGSVAGDKVDYMLREADKVREKAKEYEALEHLAATAGTSLTADDIIFKKGAESSSKLLATVRRLAIEQPGFKFIAELGCVTSAAVKLCGVPKIYYTDQDCFEQPPNGQATAQVPKASPSNFKVSSFDARVHFDLTTHSYMHSSGGAHLPGSTLLASMVTPETRSGPAGKRGQVAMQEGTLRHDAYSAVQSAHPFLLYIITVSYLSLYSFVPSITLLILDSSMVDSRETRFDTGDDTGPCPGKGPVLH
jgi:hypothetical protein